MTRYIKNFLLFLVISSFITGCSSKFDNDNSGLSYQEGENGYIFQSASLENTIQQRDLRLQKYKKVAKSKKKLDSFNALSNQNDRFDLNLELFDFYSEWERVEYQLGKK